MKLTPYPEQEEAIQRMVSEPTRAALLGADLGKGKTLMAVETVRRLDAKVILVIGPLNVDHAWRDRFAGQGVDLPFANINSTKAGLEAFERLRTRVPGIYYIGREFFALSGTSSKPKVKSDGTKVMPKRPREARWSWAKVKPDFTIFDEVHCASNRKSSNASALMPLKPGYKLALSATAAGNKFSGLWSVCRWLWPEHIPRSFWAWANQWADVYDDYSSGRAVKMVGAEKNPGAFVRSLPCYIFMSSDLPAPKVVRFECPLTPEQTEQFKWLRDKMLVWIEDNPLVADIPITQRIRLDQVSLAALSLNVSETVDGELTETVYFEPDAPSSKIDALHKIIEANPDDCMLVLTHSQKFASVVAHRLGDAAVEWSGKTSQGDRKHILETFGKPGGPRYIVAVIEAIAEGVDGLQHHARIAVWMSKSTNGLKNTQALGRLNRTGQKRQVVSVELVAPNTLDKSNLNRLNVSAAEMRRTLTNI